MLAEPAELPVIASSAHALAGAPCCGVWPLQRHRGVAMLRGAPRPRPIVSTPRASLLKARMHIRVPAAHRHPVPTHRRPEVGRKARGNAGAGSRSGTETSSTWHQARNGHFACDQYGLPDVPRATAPGPATTRRRGSAGERGRGWRREGVVQERTEEISVTPHADPTGREQTPPKQSSRAGPVATKTPAGSPSRRSASAAA